MHGYRALTEIPPLVREAMERAERAGFEQSCIPAVGRLLRTLAGQVQFGTIAELGTGCGAGAAWIAGALRPGVSFVTVELDHERARAARELFGALANVEVVQGDWRVILDRAPFALLFADGGAAKANEPETLLNALGPGGVIVLDDLTPVDRWPAEWRGRRDRVRDFWLNDPRLNATEALTTPETAAILASRSSS